MSAAAPTRRAVSTASFLRARLGSLLAVVPLGVWTVAHLWNNLSAFKGGAAWQADVTEYSHPLAFFASSVVALLPLVLHTVWGIGRLVTAQPNNVKYKYFANLKYTLQRLSAVGVMLFLGAHLWLAMLHPRITTGRPEPFADIAHEMHHHAPDARRLRARHPRRRLPPRQRAADLHDGLGRRDEPPRPEEARISARSSSSSSCSRWAGGRSTRSGTPGPDRARPRAPVPRPALRRGRLVAAGAARIPTSRVRGMPRAMLTRRLFTFGLTTLVLSALALRPAAGRSPTTSRSARSSRSPARTRRSAPTRATASSSPSKRSTPRAA